MSTVTLPAPPSAVPALEVATGAIEGCAAQLLAASAQIDDLGTFVADRARAIDWRGEAAHAYRSTVAPLGRRADAMSLALRSVARRVQVHADRMGELARTHADMGGERQVLANQLGLLRQQVAQATVGQAAELQFEADAVARRVGRFERDLEALVLAVAQEESEMRAAFARVLTMSRIQDRYAGVPDPADAALAGKPPGGASPNEVRRWWDGMGEQEREALIAASPGSLGNLDGIPAEARHQANTVSLDRDLAEWRILEERGVLTGEETKWLDNAAAADEARRELADLRDPITDQPVDSQIYLYDPSAFDGDGRVAISAGDLDSADNVAVVVPGLGTDGGSAGYQAARAATLYESTRYLDPSQSNATMFWIGYDAPDNVPWDGGVDWLGVTNEQMARAGGERLADTIDGLRASRDGDPAHLTVVGHSYGSTTTGHAAHDQGLSADDIVFVGSPGVGGETDHASDLGIEVGHVWSGANSHDLVADLGNHGAVHGETLFGAGLGDDPVEDDFGATRFTAESVSRGEGAHLADHSKYFDHDTESLYNISQIINGTYDGVIEADHVHDPWFGDPVDPEADREPTTPVTVEP
ncbi:alpha/beta hydrolase [Nocardioides salsibiostraticola]